MGSLLEMMIVLTALAVGAVQTVREKVEQQRTQALTAQGQVITVINNGLGTYTSDHYGALTQQPPQAINGFSDPMHPTVGELAAAGYLNSPSYTPKPFWGGTFQTQINLVPTGCSVAVGNCNLTSTLWASQPLTRAGRPDVAGAGALAAAAGGNVGFSTVQNTTVVSGANGAWSAPSPVPNSAAIIAAVNSFGASGLDGLYPRDGSRPLTAPLNGGGQDANGLRNINASGTVSANAVTVTGSVTAPTMNLGTPSGACQRGQVSLVSNVEFICNQSGAWINAGNLIGNVYTVQKYLSQTDGSGVGKPVCQGGTATASIIPQTVGMNAASNPPWESSVYKLNDQGTWWYVQISIQDANGTWYSGNQLGLNAEVDAQCQFSNE